MGSAIHLMKIFIFQDYLNLSTDQINDITAFVSFIVYVYFPNWFGCSKIEDVPALTLKLQRDLSSWCVIDPEGAKAASRKLDLHTEYVNGRNVVLAFASDKISDVEKQQLAARLLETPEIELECGKPGNPYVYEDSELTEFINEDSWLIFQLCSIERSFLSLPVSDWPRTESFQAFFSVVKGLQSLNDPAERAVKFGTDFHGRLAENTDQHQAVLQNVELHRRKRPKTV